MSYPDKPIKTIVALSSRCYQIIFQDGTDYMLDTDEEPLPTYFPTAVPEDRVPVFVFPKDLMTAAPEPGKKTTPGKKAKVAKKATKKKVAKKKVIKKKAAKKKATKKPAAKKTSGRKKAARKTTPKE